MISYGIDTTIHSDGYYTLWYIDRKVLYVNCISIVIDAGAINRILGTIEGFAKLYNLKGQTNGELLILSGIDPLEFLITTLDDVLNPEGFQVVRDFIILWKERNYTADDYIRLFEYVSFDWDDWKRTDWLQVCNPKALTPLF